MSTLDKALDAAHAASWSMERLRQAIEQSTDVQKMSREMVEIDAAWRKEVMQFDREKVDAYHDATLALTQSVAQSSTVQQIRGDTIEALKTLQAKMVDIGDRYRAGYENFKQQLADLANRTKP